MDTTKLVIDYDHYRESINLILAELEAVLQQLNKEEPDED
jgi:hypothetical protein